MNTTLTGPVEVAVYRVRAPFGLVAAPLVAEGVRIARTPVGAEAEALLLRAGALPRRGVLLDLIRHETLPPRAPTGDEADPDESPPLWGSTTGPSIARDLPTGSLPTGLYLVRAMAGGWATSSLLSVGSLTLLARRGDSVDRVFVTDAEGAPQSAVTVHQLVGGRVVATRATDPSGAASFPASDVVELRYLAARGADLAWTDVAHVRASTCDVRVELATGRPRYGERETMGVRGTLRGCDAGTDAPIAGERVEVCTAGRHPCASATTAGDGSFVVSLPSSGELIARVRGVEHRRTVASDAGMMFAAGSMHLGFDRAWAAPGEEVTATVGDETGAWPRRAQLHFSVGDVRGAGAVGPRYPGVFTFTMPPTSSPLTRVAVRAEFVELSRTTYVVNELWTGTSRDRFDHPAEWIEPRAVDRPWSRVASGDALDVTVAPTIEPTREGLTIGLRAPPFGSTLLTLERGDVWSSRVVASGDVSASLPVPPQVRGLATVLATHVHAGEVTMASAPVDIEATRRFRVRVTTDALGYPAGATARVTIAARDPDGRPLRATATLWVADATWWEGAADDHPSPAWRLRGVERPAARGDSTRPRGDGAEEGRRFTTVLEWNGRPLPGATFRHAWGHAEPTARFDARGTFTEIATRLALAGGLAEATVCAETEASLGAVHLRVQNVPWALAAERIGGATSTTPTIEDGALRFECGVEEGDIGMGNIGTSGHGSGIGSGEGYGSGGRRVLRSVDGTAVFVAAVPIGESGDATVDVLLPSQPGRWRYEVLAIGADGGRATDWLIAPTH